MAGKGFAPKETRSRPTDDRARQDEMVKLTESDEAYGPELPDCIWWHEQTRVWWETWRRSPMAATMIDTDWSFMLETARIHTLFWAGDEKLAAELRLRVAKYGGTYEDRMRLKLQVEKPTPTAKKPEPAQDKDRRERLLQAVGE